MRSRPCRFTEFCNSRCLSHFAAPFIADRTETSIAESCTKMNQHTVFKKTENTRSHTVVHEGRQTCTRASAFTHYPLDPTRLRRAGLTAECRGVRVNCANDPSAGSPTETLLRLLLPLNDKVRMTSLHRNRNRHDGGPKGSPEHSIGRSDGRCVQRAGT